MKYVLEFGIRGGYHVENLVFDSKKLAERVAVAVRNTVEPDNPDVSRTWGLNRNTQRVSWANATHFVSLSRCPNTFGPASTKLWEKD